MAAERGKFSEEAFDIEEQWKENDLDFKKIQLFKYWNIITLSYKLPWWA